MNIDNAIANTLKKVREERGISQEQLAFDCNLHRTYISQLERGLKSITVKSLFKITTSLDIKIEDFIKIVTNELEKISTKQN